MYTLRRKPPLWLNSPSQALKPKWLVFQNKPIRFYQGILVKFAKKNLKNFSYTPQSVWDWNARIYHCSAQNQTCIRHASYFFSELICRIFKSLREKKRYVIIFCVIRYFEFGLFRWPYTNYQTFCFQQFHNITGKTGLSDNNIHITKFNAKQKMRCKQKIKKETFFSFYVW